MDKNDLFESAAGRAADWKPSFGEMLSCKADDPKAESMLQSMIDWTERHIAMFCAFMLLDIVLILWFIGDDVISAVCYKPYIYGVGAAAFLFVGFLLFGPILRAINRSAVENADSHILPCAPFVWAIVASLAYANIIALLLSILFPALLRSQAPGPAHTVYTQVEALRTTDGDSVRHSVEFYVMDRKASCDLDAETFKNYREGDVLQVTFREDAIGKILVDNLIRLGGRTIADIEAQLTGKDRISVFDVYDIRKNEYADKVLIDTTTMAAHAAMRLPDLDDEPTGWTSSAFRLKRGGSIDGGVRTTEKFTPEADEALCKFIEGVGKWPACCINGTAEATACVAYYNGKPMLLNIVMTCQGPDGKRQLLPEEYYLPLKRELGIDNGKKELPSVETIMKRWQNRTRYDESFLANHFRRMLPRLVASGGSGRVVGGAGSSLPSGWASAAFKVMRDGSTVSDIHTVKKLTPVVDQALLKAVTTVGSWSSTGMQGKGEAEVSVAYHQGRAIYVRINMTCIRPLDRSTQYVEEEYYLPSGQ